MNFIDIFFVSVGLAMDAFAVAVCKGSCIKNIRFEHCLKIGFVFGLFQAIMPFIGFVCGSGIRNFFFSFDHYVVFCLLTIIGANMIYEALCIKESSSDDNIAFISLFVPAIATSIDAFSVGISFAFLEINIIIIVLIIGIVACIMSMLGVKIGNCFGNRNEKVSKIFGGIVLIIMAIRVLLKHFY